MNPVVLVDMDGVLADYCTGFTTVWRGRYPDEYCPDMATLDTFYIEDKYSPELKPLVAAIDREEGFFRGLPPIPGSIEGMKHLRSLPMVDMKICTSPVRSPYCMMEKYLWIEHYLGYDWLKDLIFTKDKTMIRGDYLIDDKPEITGLYTPHWEHIVFDQPYNRLINDRMRLDWNNYQWLVGLIALRV